MKTNNVKKVLAAMCSSILLVGALTGCGGEKKAAAPAG
jgi:predicted small lipoprotein YifL